MVAVFTNSLGQLLVCERSDTAGAWQFPQGGIDPGESAINALYREMREELGCDEFKVVKEASGIIKYKFPEDLKGSIAKKWIGQSQYWFHTKFDAGAGPHLENGDNEFVNFKWTDAQDAASNIIEWKREAYNLGLTRLGLLTK